MVEQLPSAAVMEAQSRRLAANDASILQTKWFIDNVCDVIRISLKNRVRIATEMVRSKIVKNISRPVTKTATATGIRVSNRSKPGEFPKADMVLLLKTIFLDVREEGEEINGFIGTPLDYGVWLELKMNRSFFVRTLIEEHSNIVRVLTGPIT